ncbi:hypothetical protein PAHAL_2G074900 [Panicum hallii]|uniref:Uncharacterized protein n=1 Tax=Panicum hallii TaxID=206008 RepID=A0A2S3GWL5_9POAL|nr:uncharacterized protein LOC112881639 isoform X1 [Panicum hallii]PAN10163.1 hypothetical protein PAHAL_2G074900 [Panicum hallii]
MASSKKPSLFVSLLLLSLVVSAVHGAQPADAGDTAAAGGGERVTVRSSGHGHGYSSSHSGGHTSGGTPKQGGAGSVDPRNLNARSHHRSGAASRAGLGCSSLSVAWGLVGATLAVVVLP